MIGGCSKTPHAYWMVSEHTKAKDDEPGAQRGQRSERRPARVASGEVKKPKAFPTSLQAAQDGTVAGVWVLSQRAWVCSHRSLSSGVKARSRASQRGSVNAERTRLVNELVRRAMATSAAVADGGRH